MSSSKSASISPHARSKRKRIKRHHEDERDLHHLPRRSKGKKAVYEEEYDNDVSDDEDFQPSFDSMPNFFYNDPTSNFHPSKYQPTKSSNATNQVDNSQDQQWRQVHVLDNSLQCRLNDQSSGSMNLRWQKKYSHYTTQTSFTNKNPHLIDNPLAQGSQLASGPIAAKTNLESLERPVPVCIDLADSSNVRFDTFSTRTQTVAMLEAFRKQIPFPVWIRRDHPPHLTQAKIDDGALTIVPVDETDPELLKYLHCPPRWSIRGRRIKAKPGKARDEDGSDAPEQDEEELEQKQGEEGIESLQPWDFIRLLPEKPRTIYTPQRMPRTEDVIAVETRAQLPEPLNDDLNSGWIGGVYFSDRPASSPQNNYTPTRKSRPRSRHKVMADTAVYIQCLQQLLLDQDERINYERTELERQHASADWEAATLNSQLEHLRFVLSNLADTQPVPAQAESEPKHDNPPSKRKKPSKELKAATSSAPSRAPKPVPPVHPKEEEIDELEDSDDEPEISQPKPPLGSSRPIGTVSKFRSRTNTSAPSRSAPTAPHPAPLSTAGSVRPRIAPVRPSFEALKNVIGFRKFAKNLKRKK
ncbi:hypothetical protein DM01DRAFT_1406101 [Hesseltinella vesiculosa]|uniref:Uncharacterized protein n=1 Tax=Hesseltinella vesiculosa TaxID=101127 RepID=A0A1X2GN43_9FUNG|nr:hypothetical protein DM01DRAFT_1406101 [Hesseltinella vesiculosa]